jgi:hypothetical protein
MRRGAVLVALAALAGCSGSLEGVGAQVGADVVVDVVDASPDVAAPDAEPDAAVEEDAALQPDGTWSWVLRRQDRFHLIEAGNKM